jgi:hypothetical protein
VKRIVTAGFLACWLVVVACGGSMKSAAMAPVTPADASGATMPGDRHGEIDELAAQIDDALVKANVAPSEPAACQASHSCTAVPFDVKPRIEDATCKAPTTDTCTQSCTLSDSVCENAGKICKIAKQLGEQDGYANSKCQSANDSCKRTRESCCQC